MKALSKKLTDVMEGLSMVFIMIMLVVVAIQVTTRLTIKTSPRWCEEVASILMSWFAFLGMAIGVGEGIHMSIEFIINLLPKSLRKAVIILGELLVIYLGFSLLWFGTRLVYATQSSTLPATKWPAFMPYLMTPIAGLAIVIYSFIKLFDIIKDKELVEIKAEKLIEVKVK
ncbi:MAG: TRAP transporter small permease [Tissierella sp.]|nr:TRAP transporter small permease [Tissierella sp.]